MSTKTIEFTYKRCVTGTFAYNAELSKNRMTIFSKKKKNKKIPNPIHEMHKETIQDYFDFHTKHKKFKKEPAFLHITVFRPRNMGDAHNFIDGIADAVEKGIGLDDRYFHVYSKPAIDKENPRIVIEVYQ